MTTTTTLPTGTWQLDTSATTITVAVRKMGLFTVPATLAATSGTIEIDENHQVVSVDIVADASSYTSKNAKRNEHVLGNDLLDAATHPTISFGAGTVTATASGHEATGTVTLKGQTSPVDVTITDVEFNDSSGSFTATATVDRMTIGVDKMPTFVVGRNLDLTVKASATRTS